MLNKNVFKDIQSLGHKKSREEAGLFVAEGPKVVSELLSIAPTAVEKIYAIDEWAVAHGENSKVEVVSQSDIERLSFLKTPNQVVALVKQFPSKQPESSGIVLYLDTIQDPGNFGTIVRIADWFGVTDVVCTEGCADLYNPKVVQATMASIARVNVFYDVGQRWIKQQKMKKVAATLNGTPLEEFHPFSPGILIIGNESRGIGEELISIADEQITISKKGAAESLNAAVATGIILSHLI